MTLSSEQLEREAERARAQVADTLDELRNRISPGQVVDEFVDYARERGIGDFTRNLGNDVRANPLPVALIGAGDASRTFIEFAMEQPLVLAGIGLAIGAAIGAALPSTATEDRLMGEASDDVKEGVADLAAEQYQKVQAVAEKAIGDAARAAQ